MPSHSDQQEILTKSTMLTTKSTILISTRSFWLEAFVLTMQISAGARTTSERRHFKLKLQKEEFLITQL